MVTPCLATMLMLYPARARLVCSAAAIAKSLLTILILVCTLSAAACSQSEAGGAGG